MDGESLFEVWERYKELIRACSYHRLEKWLIIHTFDNRLLYNTRMTINVVAEGALMYNPLNDVYALIEDMAQNHYRWGSERTPIEKTKPNGGMYEVIDFDHMNAQVDALYQRLDNLLSLYHLLWLM